MSDIFELTNGKWPSILRELGVNEKLLRGEHGPCPFCGGTDRFNFCTDARSLIGKWFCNQCSHGDGVEYVKRIRDVSFLDACAILEGIVGSDDTVNFPKKKIIVEKTDEEKLEYVRRLLKETRSIKASVVDPAYLYLLNAGIYIKPEHIADLRYHPDCPMPGGDKNPAIFAVIRDSEFRGVSAQRLFITLEGHKAKVKIQKATLPGRDLNGSAVWLGARDGKTCVVGEGVITTLRAMQRFKTESGYAAISAAGLKTWVPPPFVRHVFVTGDNDSHFKGQSAAYHLANRLSSVAWIKSVSVEIPPTIGTDWEDYL